MNQKKVTILGSTGSIGTQTLEVIRRHPAELRVQALVCHSSADLLVAQALEFHPHEVVIVDPEHYKRVRKALAHTDIIVRTGAEEVCLVAGSMDTDIVVTAMVGFAGLAPTIAAIQAGHTIALANKETLVVAGELITELCRKSGSVILPVDSEHSAIFQCLVGERIRQVERIYLTASGGPFVDMSMDSLHGVRPEDALKHPKWNMGSKVTIDSASLMNKGLEMIEAHYLFQVEPKDIEVLVHRQSIVHSMVGYKDGSIKAQLGIPDMKLPIAYALLFPHRMPGGTRLPRIDEMASLTFEPPRTDVFPCLGIAYDALDMGGTATCTMNAANEIAVQRFLSGEIRFTDIPRIILHTMDKCPQRSASSLALLEEADRHAREIARAWTRTA